MYVLEGLMLTIGSLLFTILLCIVYFSKKRFLSLRNKVYRYMIVIEIVLLVTEIITFLFASYFSSNELLILFLYRAHWITGFLWLGLLYLYTLIFLNDYNFNSLKEFFTMNKKNRTAFIIFIIILIGYFFVPFERLDVNNINYLPGPAAYYTISYCVLMVISILINTIKKGKNISTSNKAAIIVMIIELIFTLIFQILYPKICFYGLSFTLELFLLYFIIENPDLKVINELEEVKSEIEKSSKAKIDFLSNMSHEIRTPMNAIIGFSSSLVNNKKFDVDSVKEDINHIEIAGNNLLDIINNILDISKIESGKDTLDLKEYSIINIVSELRSIIESRIGSKPVKLYIELDENIPSKLYGDSVKIYQILLNILTNSVKYTEVGKIKLTVSCNNYDNNTLLHFKISDTGYGIKKEDYNKLFEKFSRLDNAKSNEIEGTGLGLVITKKYVDLMHGKIWFDSEYEVGTNFYVDLSQKIINSSKIGESLNDNKKDNELDIIDCSSYNVLIVDDNKLNIKVATRLLEPYKFKIDTSDSGKDCIFKVKSGKKYDIIFLDHMMPEMDGIEVMHVLKKLNDYDIPPIVALTANAITGMREMYLKEGFDEYLSKPINVNELNKLILKYFGGK